MSFLVVFAIVLAVCIASILVGESRWDLRDRRPWWPGARRR